MGLIVVMRVISSSYALDLNPESEQAAMDVISRPTVSAAPTPGPGSFALAQSSNSGGASDQPVPYLAPAETLGRRSGAPEGKVSAPAHHASRAAYPGYSFEYETYVPAQYEATRPAALTVFQDGAHYPGITEAKFN